ncbi:class I SAM-dependent methyltransferase [Patescibacteria group bacterium]|nr:class I SAM-dependent methyltransferase [Patescibacteria group bacterium]MBU4480778.1 class I SAM-dependent methyltransferase [Patescibacteria group bacterium]
MNLYRIFHPFYEKAAKEMSLDCQDFIKEGSKILDLGCGSGIVGKKFQDYFKAELIGIDVKDRRLEKIPFQKFNGRDIPFSENNFDVVLISYVLHHAGDPTALLKEAKRVGERVIVYEDLPEGFLSGLFCRLHGISFDKLFGNPNPTSFRTEKKWEDIFKEIGLNLIFKKEIKNFPVKKELFVLGV